MPVDYSISLNGILNADRNLNQTAHRIASANLPSANSCEDRVTLSDFAMELLSADQAKNAGEANLQVISMRQELDREALDLFA